MKKILFLSIILLLSQKFYAQSTPVDSGKVNWITLDEARQKFDKKKQAIFIYIHDNSKESKAMLDTTFKIYEVANYLNVRFYCVKIDAYTKEKITHLDGKTYENKTGGVHDFATFILGNEPKFPAMVLLNTDGYGSSFSGYYSRDAIFPTLIFTSENIYKSTNYEDWFELYDKTYPSENSVGYTMTRSLVKWISFEEAIEKNKTQKRKFFVDIYANWNVGATVMFIAAYNNPAVAKILNEKYYPIRLDALSRDTVTVNGVEYFNRGEANTFHDLAVAMLEGKMTFPAFLILNNEIKPLHKNQHFQTYKALEPLLEYFASDKFKEEKYKSYKVFLKEFNE